MTTTAIGLDHLHELVGKDLGYSPWLLVDQRTIDLFAEATGDHQWIHVDPERAKAGPFGTTIAHGYLTLSFVPRLLPQLLVIEGYSMGVNYGCNRVRFPAPVPVDTNVHLAAKVAQVEDVPGGVQAVIEVTIEAEGGTKPCMVAEVVYRYFF